MAGWSSSWLKYPSICSFATRSPWRNLNLCNSALHHHRWRSIYIHVKIFITTGGDPYIHTCEDLLHHSLPDLQSIHSILYPALENRGQNVLICVTSKIFSPFIENQHDRTEIRIFAYFWQLRQNLIYEKNTFFAYSGALVLFCIVLVPRCIRYIKWTQILCKVHCIW